MILATDRTGYDVHAGKYTIVIVQYFAAGV